MGRGKHVMLSYNWDHQDLVSKIYDRLTEVGIPCWMDIKGDMAGSINDAMADGAEKAALIVPFCTEKYQNSKNCRRELMYADQEGVKIVPVLCDDKKYKPKAWLGIVIAGLLYFDFRNEAKFEQKLKELIFEIKKAAPHIVDQSMAEEVIDSSDDEDVAPPKYEEKRKKQLQSDNVKFVYGNTYYHIPDTPDRAMGNNGKSPVEHRWKLFLKIVEGNPKLIKKVTFDLGKYLNPSETSPGHEKFTPNENNEFIHKQDQWGGFKQRPRKIIVDFKNGMQRVYEHTLHGDDGFMSCVLSLKSRNEPIEYVYGNTYEHIEDPKYTSEGKALEHRWKLFLRILKGDPTYIKKVDIDLGSNWKLRSQSAPDQENEFSTGYETSWGAIQSKERKIIIHFQDGSVKEIGHTLDISGDGKVSAPETFYPPEDTCEVMPFEMVQNCALSLANDPDQLDFKFTLNGTVYAGILHKN